MRSPTKMCATAGLALGSALLAAPTQAATLPLPYTYSFLPGTNGYLEQLTISDPFSFSLTNVTINEYPVSNPNFGLLPTTTDLNGDPLVIAPGGSIMSDPGSGAPTSFELPLGPQPQNILIDPNTQNPIPFVINATATGNGQAYGFTITQTYSPNGIPTAVPEPGTEALLAAGLGLLGVAGLRRRHRG